MVFVPEDERAELVERAAQADMSQSALLRAVGLNIGRLLGLDL